MSASYSAVLFMHSNSKKIEIKWFLCSGSIKMQLAPNPSCVLEPSKYIVKISYVHWLGTTLVLLQLLLPIKISLSQVEQGRRSNCVSSRTGDKHDQSVAKYPYSFLDQSLLNNSLYASRMSTITMSIYWWTCSSDDKRMMTSLSSPIVWRWVLSNWIICASILSH